MNDINMSEMFPEAFQVDHNKSFEVQDVTWYSYGSKYESDGDQDSAIEHAVLNHDRLQQENAELREAIEAAMRVKDLWLPMHIVANEHEGEAVALHSMYKNFEAVLSKIK